MKKEESSKSLRSNKMDHPEQYETSNESLFDKFESERTVDPIPMEDLTEEKQEEKHPHDTKDTSSSEKKFSGL